VVWDKVLDFLSRAWLPIFILGWSATAFALQTVRALMSDEIGKLYVTAAGAGRHGPRLLWRYPARHALGPIVNSLGFDLNRIFNELPIVALILTLTEAGALLIEALARSNDQQLGRRDHLPADRLHRDAELPDRHRAGADRPARAQGDGRMTDAMTAEGLRATTDESAEDLRRKEAYFTASQGQLIWARFKKQRAAMVAARC
jgi:hypothetical protein